MRGAIQILALSFVLVALAGVLASQPPPATAQGMGIITNVTLDGEPVSLNDEIPLVAGVPQRNRKDPGLLLPHREPYPGF